MNPPASIVVFTRRNPEATAVAVRRLAQLAAEHDVEVHIPAEEVEKHGFSDLSGAVLGADPDDQVDLAVVLGGDGTILSTMRRFAGRGVPVFAVNFGEIGFLSTVESVDLDAGLTRALRGDFEVLALPALMVDTPDGERVAVNDISLHRRQDLRVARIGYSVAGQELGAVRSDGIVVSTPAGSTGYNLANGGPVLAWGVEGYVVSFIAPHTLTARGLVVAPDDVLEIVNRSPDEPVDMTTDGRPAVTLGPGESLSVRFRDDVALLAQLSGVSFYGRLRERFGRLSE